MNKRIKSVQPDQIFGDLETRWYWNTESGERTQKYACACGGYCMVKERSLTEYLIADCGCEEEHGR